MSLDAIGLLAREVYIGEKKVKTVFEKNADARADRLWTGLDTAGWLAMPAVIVSIALTKRPPVSACSSEKGRTLNHEGEEER